MRRNDGGKRGLLGGRWTASRRWWALIVATGITGVLGLCAPAGAALAASVSVEASSNCSGPDAWVVSWIVSVSSDTPSETWRVDTSAGTSDVRPIGDVILLEAVLSMNEPTAHLDAVATLVESGETLSTSAIAERPTMCISAPAPATVVAETSPTLDQSAEVGAGPEIGADQPDPVAGSPVAAPPALTSPALSPAATPPAVLGSAPEAAELPATGSTSTVLVLLALTCISVGLLLLRIGTRPPAPLLSAPTAPFPRQLSSVVHPVPTQQVLNSRRQP